MPSTTSDQSHQMSVHATLCVPKKSGSLCEEAVGSDSANPAYLCHETEIQNADLAVRSSDQVPWVGICMQQPCERNGMGKKDPGHHCNADLLGAGV